MLQLYTASQLCNLETHYDYHNKLWYSILYCSIYIPYTEDRHDWSQFCPTTGPKARLQTMQDQFREETVNWYSVYNGMAPTYLPDLNPIEPLWKQLDFIVRNKCSSQSNQSNVREVQERIFELLNGSVCFFYVYYCDIVY